MSLTKNQTIAAVSIGGFVLAAGVLGWFLYDAITVRGEQEEDLAQQMASFRRFNDSPVFPSPKTIAMVDTNKAELAAWRTAAREYAARGDKNLAAETPPIFKQRLAATVRKMGSHPGAASGHIAAPNFQFGFETYLGDGGILPDVKEVPHLAAQLDAIKYVVDVLAKAGTLEIREVRRIEPPVEPENARASAKGKANRSRPSAKGDAAKKPADAAAVPEPTSLDYFFSFTVRPDAFVKVLNALSSGDRFLVVKEFAFRDVADDILTQMSAADAAKTATQNPGGSRRRRHAAAQQPAAEETETKPKAVTVVCDPESGSPIQVEMTVSVWNFGTGAAAAHPAAGATQGAAAPSQPKAKNNKESSK